MTRIGALFLCGLLLAGAIAQKPPKPKPVVQMALLPVLVQAPELSDDSKDTIQLLVRGSVLAETQARLIGSISPILIETSERELETKFDNPVNWTTELFGSLCRRWMGGYVVGIQITELKTEERAAGGNPPAPGGSLEATAKVKVWVWEHKSGAYLAEGKEETVTRTSARPGPSQNQVEKELALAAKEAILKAMKPLLDKYPKPKKPREGK